MSLCKNRVWEFATIFATIFATRLWNMPLGPAASSKKMLAGLGRAGPGRAPQAASCGLGLANFLPPAALAAPAMTAAGQAQHLAGQVHWSSALTAARGCRAPFGQIASVSPSRLSPTQLRPAWPSPAWLACPDPAQPVDWLGARSGVSQIGLAQPGLARPTAAWPRYASPCLDRPRPARLSPAQLGLAWFGPPQPSQA